METVYYKKVLPSGKVKYVEAGYANVPDLSDGIWLVRRTGYSKRTTSLIWKIGNIPLADMNIHAALQKFDDRLAEYIEKLNDIDSEEYKEAIEVNGSYILDKLEIYNWSRSDLATMILRQLAKWTQEDIEKVDMSRILDNSEPNKLDDE